MRQDLEPEQTVQSLPLVSSNESESANSHVLDAQSQTEEMESALAVVRQQSRLNHWFGGLFLLLYGLLSWWLLAGIHSYSYVSFYEGHAAKLVFDFGTVSFGAAIKHGTGHSVVTVNGTLPLLLLCGLGVCAALAKRGSRKMARTLKGCDDVRAVGLLAEVLSVRDKSVRTQAAADLIRVLPRLRPQDKSLLKWHQRVSLWLYLGNPLPNDDELSLAILDAYWSIGDGTELTTVKRLVQGTVGSAREGRVREAAQRYLDEVRRRDEETVADTLLRASNGPAVAPDTLLRPAAEATESDPRHLLRANPNRDKTANAPEDMR
jgi:hypothetical protein